MGKKFRVTGFVKGYNWYGAEGYVGFARPLELTQKELENLPLEDYAEYGFQEVTGLILFVKDIIEHNGEEYINMSSTIETKGDITEKDVEHCLQAAQVSLSTI